MYLSRCVFFIFLRFYYSKVFKLLIPNSFSNKFFFISLHQFILQYHSKASKFFFACLVTLTVALYCPNLAFLDILLDFSTRFLPLLNFIVSSLLLFQVIQIILLLALYFFIFCILSVFVIIETFKLLFPLFATLTVCVVLTIYSLSPFTQFCVNFIFFMFLRRYYSKSFKLFIPNSFLLLIYFPNLTFPQYSRRLIYLLSTFTQFSFDFIVSSSCFFVVITPSYSTCLFLTRFFSELIDLKHLHLLSSKSTL